MAEEAFPVAAGDDVQTDVILTCFEIQKQFLRRL